MQIFGKQFWNRCSKILWRRRHQHLPTVENQRIGYRNVSFWALTGRRKVFYSLFSFSYILKKKSVALVFVLGAKLIIKKTYVKLILMKAEQVSGQKNSSKHCDFFTKGNLFSEGLILLAGFILDFRGKKQTNPNCLRVIAVTLSWSQWMFSVVGV